MFNGGEGFWRQEATRRRNRRRGSGRTAAGSSRLDHHREIGRKCGMEILRVWDRTHINGSRTSQIAGYPATMCYSPRLRHQRGGEDHACHAELGNQAQWYNIPKRGIQRRPAMENSGQTCRAAWIENGAPSRWAPAGQNPLLGSDFESTSKARASIQRKHSIRTRRRRSRLANKPNRGSRPSPLASVVSSSPRRFPGGVML
jgi:hypothetical protein